MQGLAQRRVARGVALAEGFGNRPLAHGDDYLAQTPAEEVDEGRCGILFIRDGDVEQGVKLAAQRGQRNGQAAGLGLEQVAIRRAGAFMFGGLEAGALQKVDHRGRYMRKLLAGFARNFEVALEALGVTGTTHEGKVERPPGRTHHWHVDQFLLEEKLEQRNLAIEDLLQHQNINPRLMVA